MEDSPLSIVASVTGILTFIAAIIGFVYVRYRILNNGKQEIVSTKESVVAFLRDTASFQQMLLQPVIQQDSNSDLRQIILHKLYTTELQILRLYRQSDFIGELRSILGDADAQRWREGLVTACFWERWNGSWNATTDVLRDRHVSPELLRNRIISGLRRDAEEAFRSRRLMTMKKRMDFVRGLIGI
ncbi:class II myosin [Pestalotiopsis sp. IQ-011]